MNTANFSSDVPDDTPLVEPTTQSGVPTEAVDRETDRILRETGSLVAPGETAQPATSPATTQTPPAQTTEQDPPHKSWNVLAVIAFVLGLALSPFAMVFGYLALGQIRRSGQNGENTAVAAIILGWIWTLVFGVAGIVMSMVWFQL